VRVEETFAVGQPPKVVFDYMTDASNLADWQTAHTSTEQLTEGPPRLGSRFRERLKPPFGREFEQVTEFTEFDRPRRFHVHIVEGRFPVDGTWSLEPDGSGTRVQFVAEGELHGLMRLLEPIVVRVLARQFAGYHRNLSHNLESR
jgi:carbon monoxide dehydrogenase subunit G